MTDFAADAALAKKGDAAAFARLYAKIYEDLYRIARYSLRNREDACDAVSDAVLEAFCNIGKLRDEKAFRSWMMRILSAQIRRRQREYYHAPSVLEESMGEDFDFRHTELREALAGLSSEDRLLLSLSVLGGYTGKELAEVSGMREGTVRSRLSRIREKLRLALEE